MKSKSMPMISIKSPEFENIEWMTDAEAINYLLRVCLRRSRVIPKKVKYEAARVSRGQQRVTIHLHFQGRETARVSFVPAPPLDIPI
jgi:hypothetical protein